MRSFLGRKRSVRSTLFFSYLLLIVLTMAFMTVFSYFYTANALTRAAINALKDLSSKLVEALDSELFKMISYCGFIEADGSTYGICGSCKPGAQGAAKQ